MAGIKVYSLSLWDAYRVISNKLGADVRTLDLPIRVVVVSTCILMGTIVRIIFAKGLATDPEMNAIIQQVKDADFPPLPTSMPPITENNAGDPMSPDLGS